MISEWHDKEGKRIWDMHFSSKLPQDIQKTARRKLVVLNSAVSLNDLRIPPSNHLEELSGDRKGQHSIRINDTYRICFYWNDGRVIVQDICNYH
ncbi:MAG: type II toxin-antitoxin system RelE/ParE family toxin [Catonella sp.]|jgi:proteic killer suppression protein|nr:type II toxin-antitoxin system RelE/ParE family toxin [Catonella sp.]